MHGENGDDFIIGGNGDVIFANAGDDFIELMVPLIQIWGAPSSTVMMGLIRYR